MKSTYVAYDRITQWQGPARPSAELAERDAEEHRRSALQHQMLSATIAVVRDGRLYNQHGEPIWPPHGRGNGAARFRDVQP